MSASNGVIRIGRKGRKTFAFGEDGQPFEVDVVVAFQAWIGIDDQYRSEEDHEGLRLIPTANMQAYHQAAVDFVMGLMTVSISDLKHETTVEVTTAEALDFIARLREQYDELAAFFQPKLRGGARLARYFGGGLGTPILGGGELTDFDEMVLQLTMLKVQAWERLNDPDYCGKLTMRQFEGLLLEAGYSEEVAHRAALQRGWDRLSAGVAM